jgi:hypothetical protein
VVYKDCKPVKINDLILEKLQWYRKPLR